MNGNLGGRRVAVTGAAGSIGRRLVRELHARGAHVAMLDLRPDDSIHPWGRQVVGSVLEAERVWEAVSDCDAVVHLAAETVTTRCVGDPVQCFSLNVLGTVAVLEACRHAGVPHLIFASTAHVYGRPVEIPITENCPVSPLSPYAASKAAAEMAIRGQSGPAGSILRLANVYGPGLSGATLLGHLVADLRRSGKLSYRCGSPVRDFVYVDDVVETVCRLIAAGPPEPPVEVLNVGTGTGYAVRDLVKLLQDEVEAKGEARPVAVEVNPSAGDPIPELILDVAALERRLGWRPGTDLSSGLRQTLDAEDQ